ncbi:MAG: adenylate kinase [Candidatus Aminicenantes bacterium]|jgi:adenylate kinase|nr:adenylate kinase [Candidatus Aminicenantes bacterium]
MKIILLGAPGSGKGTQGDLVTKKYSFPRISTGDLLREAVALGTPLGKEAKAIMERGDLVADDLVVKMVEERITKPDCAEGYILDGFPRTINQARKLENIDKNHQEVVIEIYLPDQVVIDRLSARKICSNCGTIYNLLGHTLEAENICNVCSGKLIRRDDDKLEVIQARLKVYHEQTEPLVDYYKAKTNYFQINGEGTIEEIFARVCEVLDKAIEKAEN